MNSKTSKTPDFHRLLLNLTDKITLSNFSIYNTRENIKKSCKNKKFKISAPTWNEAFKLADGSCSISVIQDYLEYIFKKHGEKTDNPSIRIYVNEIKNIITFKIKTACYLGFLTPETMKLFGRTKSKTTKDKNGKNVPPLEIT